MTNNLQSLQVNDRVIIPAIHGRPDEAAKVIFIDRDRNWCRLLRRTGGRMALSLSTVETFKKVVPK